MQESLSNAEYDTPQQLEFDFEGYDSDPNPETSFEQAETLTLQAISSAPAFTDFFEARLIHRYNIHQTVIERL